MGKITACVKTSVNGYNNLVPDKQDEFRSTHKNFLRFYAYVTQITRMFDKDLPKSFIFCEYPFRLLPNRLHVKINLNDQIILVSSRLTEIFSGLLELKKGERETINPESKTGIKRRVEKKDLLEKIIEKANLMYQGHVTDGDRVIVETIFDRIFKRVKSYASMLRIVTRKCSREVYSPMSSKILPKTAMLNRWTVLQNFLRTNSFMPA